MFNNFSVLMTLDFDFSRSNPLMFLPSVKVENCSKLVPVKVIIVVEVVK